MNRLTYRDENGKAARLPITHAFQLLEKLAAYEDTGLEPEQVQDMMTDWVVWKEAEAGGRLIVLPCKVGDTVYRICPKCNDDHKGSCDRCAWENTGGVEGCNVFGLWGDGQFPANKCTVVPWVATYHRMPTVIDKLGSRIFLTREEAELKLERSKPHGD